MINFDRITRNIFVGTYPQSPLDIDRLRDGARITAVVNMQSDTDIKTLSIPWPKLQQHYADREIAVYRHPIRDFDPVDLSARLRAAVAQVGDLEAVGHRIYIHCTAGVGRAPAVAIGHLAWNLGWDLEEAYSFVRERRACDPYIDAIREAH
ncbi:MAG TPA: dual specificity protein phosphatase family protein [Arenicellales bacterium]|nr:dual specificity protein phosphatase family protein [Arenicellales bacterium]